MITLEKNLSDLIEYSAKAETQRDNLAQILTEKGVEADKSELFDTLIPKVADIQSGGGVYEEVYNIRTRNGTWFNGLFSSAEQMTSLPFIDTSKGTNFGTMCHTCKKLTYVPNLDVSQGTMFNLTFYQCESLTYLPPLNTSKGTNFSQCFQNCKLLSEIGGLDFSNVTSTIGLTNTFGNCGSLTDITINGTIKTNISFSSSPLSLESAKSVLTALVDYSGTSNEFNFSVTLSGEVWELLDADGETSPNGTAWRDYAENKGWLL